MIILKHKLRDGNSDLTIDVLEKELLSAFSVSSVDGLPDNYGRLYPWSLLSMFDTVDSYTLLYVDGQIWSGSGGNILYDDASVYQVGWRMFTNPKNNLTGLTRPAYTMLYALPYQIQRAKTLGCKKAIMTFNAHNFKLFRVMTSYILSEKFKKVSAEILNFTPLSEPMIINGVRQWVLELNL